MPWPLGRLIGIKAPTCTTTSLRFATKRREVNAVGGSSLRVMHRPPAKAAPTARPIINACYNFALWLTHRSFADPFPIHIYLDRAVIH